MLYRINALDDELNDEKFAARELDFEDRIDAMIDRSVKRLGQLKTMQQMGLGGRSKAITEAPPKQIESPPLAVADSAEATT